MRYAMSCTEVAETVARYGADTLSDAQIVEALLNRTQAGRAGDILRRACGLGRIVDMGPAELLALGLTKAEAARFAVLREIQRRASKNGERPRLTSPRAVWSYLQPKVQGLTEERFGLLALNAKGELLADRILSQGTAKGTLISPREFFREALRYGGTSALAWHNHPSGDPEPSPEDVLLTKRLRGAGESLGVPLWDHIIAGHDRFHSFRATEGW